MSDVIDFSGYGYNSTELNESRSYLQPALQTELHRLDFGEKRLFDLGCGNGSISVALAAS